MCYTCPHSRPSGRQVCALTGEPIVRLTCSGEPVAHAVAICPESRGPDRKGRVEWPVGSGLIWHGLPMPLRLLVCTKIGRWLLGLPRRAPGVLPMCGCYRPLKVMWMVTRRRWSGAKPSSGDQSTATLSRSLAQTRYSGLLLSRCSQFFRASR